MSNESLTAPFYLFFAQWGDISLSSVNWNRSMADLALFRQKHERGEQVLPNEQKNSLEHLKYEEFLTEPLATVIARVGSEQDATDITQVMNDQHKNGRSLGFWWHPASVFDRAMLLQLEAGLGGLEIENGCEWSLANQLHNEVGNLISILNESANGSESVAEETLGSSPEWSMPMSLAELARRIYGGEQRGRTITADFEKYRGRKAPGKKRLIQVRLDLMDSIIRGKVENR